MNNDVFPIINNKNLRKEDFIEWTNEIFRSRIKIPFIVVIVLSVIFYIILIVSFIMGIKAVSSFYIILVSVCMLIALCFRFFIPNILGKWRYAQFSLANINSYHRSVVFFEDCLDLRAEDKILSRLPYKMIQNISFTKHLLIINFPQLVACIVRFDGFSKNELSTIQNKRCRWIK